MAYATPSGMIVWRGGRYQPADLPAEARAELEAKEAPAPANKARRKVSNKTAPTEN